MDINVEKQHRTLLVFDGTKEGAGAANYAYDRAQRVRESVNGENIKVDQGVLVNEDTVVPVDGYSIGDLITAGSTVSVPKFPFRRIVKAARAEGYEQVLFAVPTHR